MDKDSNNTDTLLNMMVLSQHLSKPVEVGLVFILVIILVSLYNYFIIYLFFRLPTDIVAS